MKQYELTLEGETVALLYSHDGPRPDIVRLGSGELYKFHRFTQALVKGRTAAVYRLAIVADYPLLHKPK